ncbi:DUF2382 domain-containing protein [Rhizobium sp. Leaf386]|uniref:DUF2382 domain-containing protein n=1 Tax=Rhizobium sp. Leaf386 TaxID=1736359 RepID=UPI000AE54E46
MVSKKGRVAEEIGINKKSAGRTETISDSVRKTKVEFDDHRIEQRQDGFSQSQGYKRT